MSDIANIIGGRLRAYRIRAGLSQEELSEKADLHPTYIGQLERGEKNASLETMEKVTNALDLSFEVLFEKINQGGTDNKTARDCYELMSALPKKDQRFIFELMKKIIDYKKN